jgi:hypothetical protein
MQFSGFGYLSAFFLVSESKLAMYDLISNFLSSYTVAFLVEISITILTL